MWLFLLGSIIIFNAVAIFMKKRLSLDEIYATIMFALLAAVLVDIYAGFKYDAWGFFEKGKTEFKSLLVILGIYPAATVVIVNGYPYAARWWKKALYLLGLAVFSTVYEALTMRYNIMWHGKDWNLWMSFLLYPIIYYMLIVQLRLYRWITSKVPRCFKLTEY